jgi:hypothetical protein
MVNLKTFRKSDGDVLSTGYVLGVSDSHMSGGQV